MKHERLGEGLKRLESLADNLFYSKRFAFYGATRPGAAQKSLALPRIARLAEAGGHCRVPQPRLGRAGCEREVFASDAIATLHEAAYRALRDVDRLASAALREAARGKKKLVERDALARVLGPRALAAWLFDFAKLRAGVE